MRFLTKFDNGVNRLDGDLCSSTRVTRRPGDGLTYIYRRLGLELAVCGHYRLQATQKEPKTELHKRQEPH